MNTSNQNISMDIAPEHWLSVYHGMIVQTGYLLCCSDREQRDALQQEIVAYEAKLPRFHHFIADNDWFWMVKALKSGNVLIITDLTKTWKYERYSETPFRLSARSAFEGSTAEPRKFRVDFNTQLRSPELKAYVKDTEQLKFDLINFFLQFGTVEIIEGDRHE